MRCSICSSNLSIPRQQKKLHVTNWVLRCILHYLSHNLYHTIHVRKVCHSKNIAEYCCNEYTRWGVQHHTENGRWVRIQKFNKFFSLHFNTEIGKRHLKKNEQIQIELSFAIVFSVRTEHTLTT